MKTEYLFADKPEDIERAGVLLKAGELVAVPTETVYGLAADASNADAVAKIFEAKNRPKDHPLIVHIGSLDNLGLWTPDIPSWIEKVSNAFWPGPLTVILDKKPGVNSVVTGGLDSIGIRVPAHPALLKLLQSQNLAIAAPSANPYKKLSPTSARQVYEVMDGKIAAVLDGGPCQVGTESTILKVFPDRAEILRSGPVKAMDLQPLMSVPVVTPKTHDYAVSGNKEEHYQPNARLRLASREEILSNISAGTTNVGYLVYSELLKSQKLAGLIALPNDHRGYRQGLYHSLYQLDKLDVSEILVERPPEDEYWLDVWDRLSRAAS